MADTATDKRVLAPYYLTASDAEIEKAVVDLEVELMTRRDRAGKGQV